MAGGMQKYCLHSDAQIHQCWGPPGRPSTLSSTETPKSKLKAQVVAMPNCKVKSPRCPTLQPKVAVFGGGEGHVETG